jgi:hypothetical protein
MSTKSRYHLNDEDLPHFIVPMKPVHFRVIKAIIDAANELHLREYRKWLRKNGVLPCL